MQARCSDKRASPLLLAEIPVCAKALDGATHRNTTYRVLLAQLRFRRNLVARLVSAGLDKPLYVLIYLLIQRRGIGLAIPDHVNLPRATVFYSMSIVSPIFQPAKIFGTKGSMGLDEAR